MTNEDNDRFFELFDADDAQSRRGKRRRPAVLFAVGAVLAIALAIFGAALLADDDDDGDDRDDRTEQVDDDD